MTKKDKAYALSKIIEPSYLCYFEFILFGRGTWMKIELFTLLVKTLFQEAEMFRFTSTSLYDQSTFYDRFYKDLRGAKRRVVIESPFITQRRSTPIFTTISKLKKRRVEVIMNTNSCVYVVYRHFRAVWHFCNPIPFPNA